MATAGPALAAADEFGAYERAMEFPDIVTQSFYVPMRDGVRLAVRVDRPGRDGGIVDRWLDLRESRCGSRLGTGRLAG